MQKFDSGGVEIAYTTMGEGPPILLVHGFASNHAVNWVFTGWMTALAGAGFTAIALDNRGHGESQKLYAPEDYSIAKMAGDSLNLLDHLGIPQAAVMGYSMGGRITAWLALNAPERIEKAILGGLAENLIAGVPGAAAIASGLEAPSLEAVTDPVARTFRQFAQSTRSDLKALAACMRAPRQTMTEADLARISVPVLIVAGEKDEVSGPITRVVGAIPAARGVVLPGRNHMNAVGDAGYKAAVLDFLR
jgi:pimeloyl-ACP methyl ester carboxylesterase